MSVWQQKWQRLHARNERLGKTYLHMDEFLEDLRNGGLKEGFFLDEEAWGDLMSKIAGDKKFAKELVGSEILIVMALGSEGLKIAGDILSMARLYAEEP